MIARPVGVADFSDAAHELSETGGVLLAEHAFFGAQTEDDFRLAAKRSWLVTKASAGKLQAVTAESQFCRREHRDLGLRHQALHRGDRFGETHVCGGFIREVHEVRSNVAAI